MGQDVNVSWIAVQNDIIMSEDIRPTLKYLYIILKMSAYNDVVSIKPNLLLEKTGWSKIERLKKYLIELSNTGYIEYEDNRISKYVPIIIKTKPIDGSIEKFIKVDRELILKTIDTMNGSGFTKGLKEKGLIYLYIQEKYYNPNWGYGAPNMESVQKLLKMNNKSYVSICKLLHDNYICEWCSGAWYTNEDGSPIKTRNRYILNNMINKQGEFGAVGNRRYQRHKDFRYFFKD